MKFRILVLLVTLILFLSTCTADKYGADLILYNGKIWTGSDSIAFVEAVAITGNAISAIGNSESIRKLSGKETKLIDLEGKLAIPGFNDAHIHFQSGSIGLTTVDLTGATTIQEVVARIKKFAVENPERKWITGRGWQYTMFKNGLPTKEILDSAINDRPVFITAYDGHSAWANSYALNTSKISEVSDVEAGDIFGEIVKDSHGELTGVFKEDAMSFINRTIPSLSKEEKLDALRRGLALAKSLGITSITNASGSTEELRLYQQLLKNGELTVRVSAAFSADESTTPEQIIQYAAIKDSLKKSAMLTAGSVKFMLDGVIESHTAAMLEPYSNLSSDEHSPIGSFAIPLETYRNLVLEFDKLGFRVYTHAIGDRAVREALNVYEEVAKTNGTSARHRIEHIEMISDEDIPRFAALGVLPSMEPIHAEPGTVSVWADGVGADRLPNAFAWASILKAKGYLVFSSDWPACVSLNPIRGLHTAVTRRTTEGYPKAGWVPEQKIPIDQALKAYTQGGAYSSFEENSKGKIAPGFVGDMVILSQDLFTIDPMKTYETKVITTIFNGKVIYEANAN